MGLLSKLFGSGQGQSSPGAGAELIRLCTSGKVAVVGESHYQPALQKAARGQAAFDFNQAIPVQAVLVPEPTNRYDRNAVAVNVGGATVGYLGREIAGEYQQVLLPLAQMNMFGWCPGHIMGGGRGRSYGIHLSLAGPSRLLFTNSSDGVQLLGGDRMVTISKPDEAALRRYWDGREGSLPPLVGTFSIGKVASGKYQGDVSLELAIDGAPLGCFTPKMSHRYLPAVDQIMKQGHTPGCEVYARKNADKLEVHAMMPRE